MSDLSALVMEEVMEYSLLLFPSNIIHPLLPLEPSGRAFSCYFAF
jgi:hypothetical protein